MIFFTFLQAFSSSTTVPPGHRGIKWEIIYERGRHSKEDSQPESHAANFMMKVTSYFSHTHRLFPILSHGPSNEEKKQL